MNNCLDLSLLGLIGDKIYEPLIDSLSISLDGTCCKLIFSWLCRECIYVINITCIKDNLIISSLFEPTSSFASDFALSKLHNSYWYEVCCFLTQLFDSQDFVILLVILKILKCQKRRLTHAQSLRQVSSQHVRIRKAIECFHNRNSFVLNNSQKHKKIWFRNSFGPTNFFDDLSVALYCLEDSLNDSHNWPGIFLVGTILRINILEVIFNWFEVIFHLVEENLSQLTQRPHFLILILSSHQLRIQAPQFNCFADWRTWTFENSFIRFYWKYEEVHQSYQFM